MRRSLSGQLPHLLRDLKVTVYARAFGREHRIEMDPRGADLPACPDVIPYLAEGAREDPAVLADRFWSDRQVRPNHYLQLIRVAARLFGHALHTLPHLLHAVCRDRDRIPTVAERCVAIESPWREGGQIDGRMRFLNRLGLDDRLWKAKVLALELRRVGLPDRVQHLEKFVSPPAAVLHRGARRVELVLGPSLAEADSQPAAGQDVKSRQPAGEHDGL